MLFCCQHQIKGYQPSDVVISSDQTGTVLISGSSFVSRTETAADSSEEYLDVCAIRFETEKYGIQNLDSAFLDVRKEDCWKGTTGSAFYLFGYPSSLRQVDYEKPHIDVRHVVTSARYCAASAAEGVHRIEMTRTGSFSSDGLSGGIVFHISEDNHGFYAGFAGMILRGSDGSEFLHFIEAGYFLYFFDATLEK
jgi:hypothetical protein